jgi:hypothetical protein
MEPNPNGGPPVQRFYAAAVYDKSGNRTWGRSDDPAMFASPSDIVESDLELDKIYNSGDVEPKFQRLHSEDEPAAAAANAPPPAMLNDGLDGMTVKQLQEYAAGEEIDLCGETKKQAIIDIIRASR